MSLWVTNRFGGHLAHRIPPLSHHSSGHWPQCQLPPFFFYPLSIYPNIPLSHFFLLFLHFSNLTINHQFVFSSPTSFCQCLYSYFRLWLSKCHPPLFLAPLASFVSQSPSLSILISLHVSASCESVLVLTGLAMGCSAKCAGALGQNT